MGRTNLRIIRNVSKISVRCQTLNRLSVNGINYLVVIILDICVCYMFIKYFNSCDEFPGTVLHAVNEAIENLCPFEVHILVEEY